VALRQGVEDDLEGGGIGNMRMALAIDKFGLDVPLSGSVEKVHGTRLLEGEGNGTIANSSGLRIG
jgi:hypothetical protein